MVPFRFGPVARELFGAYHQPAAPNRKSSRILLCSPFGQEAVRAHRLYRVLADRLARAGSSVLRFDYYGTGESGGEESEADLPGWTRDVLAADAELTRRAPDARSSVWIGLGLGAALASFASASALGRPEHLILWDPVADGRDYLSHLRVQHNDWLRRSYGRPASKLAFATLDEVLGFPLSPLLRAQIESIRPSMYCLGRAQAITLLSSQGHIGAPHVADALREACCAYREVPVPAEIEWASEEAMNSALVPAGALRVFDVLLNSPQ